MRPLLHVLSVLMLLPYLVLAVAFLLLGRLIASGGLLGILGELLDQFIWIVPWGLLGFVVMVLTLVGLGFGARTLWFAGLLVGLLATGSLLVILLVPSGAVDGGQLLFLLPCALALGLGFWICLAERGLAGTTSPAAQSAPP